MNYWEECSKMIGCYQSTLAVKDSGDSQPLGTLMHTTGMPSGFANVTAESLLKSLQTICGVEQPEVADVYDVSELPNDGQRTALQRMASYLQSMSPTVTRKSDAPIPMTAFGIGMVDAGYGLSFLVSQNFFRKLARSLAMGGLGISIESTMMDITPLETFDGSLINRIAITNHGL